MSDDEVTGSMYMLLYPAGSTDKQKSIVKYIEKLLLEDMQTSQLAYLHFTSYEETFSEIELILDTGIDKRGNSSMGGNSK